MKSKLRFILTTFVFSFIFTHANALEITPLSANRVVRYSQGVLDYHIQSKLNQSNNLLVPELCFLKVTDNGISRLEIYKKTCPQDMALIAAFRSQNTAFDSMELSNVLSSNATQDLADLEKKYSAEWSEANSEQIQKLRDLVKKDTLGQLIFTSLNGKKVNIGYVDSQNRIMDLCSGSWENICYFNGKRFVLGNETRERNWELIASTNDWEWPRTYIDFTEVLFSTVYTRGNDDSRDQAIYTLKIPQTGKVIPITEEWYTFFLLNDKTKHLVDVAKDAEGKPLKSHRTRSEWNYMTAVHPIHVFKTRNRQTGEEGVQLFMGAAVSYNSSLEIEDEDCEMAETQGFLFQSPEVLKSAQPVVAGNFLTQLERSALFGELGNIWDSKAGELTKTGEAQYIPRKDPNTNENNPLSQFKYLPPLDAFPNLTIFGMTSVAPLSPNLRTQSFAILKSGNGLYEATEFLGEDISARPKEFAIFASQFNHNQIKEYLNIEVDAAGKMSVRLEGFNPNEMISTNTQRLKLENGSHEVSFDPSAVYRIWDSASDKLGSTHTISREVSSELQKLKVALNSIRYKKMRPEGQNIRKDVNTLVTELEAGRAILEEERDWLLGRLDFHYRLVGKNVYQSLGVKGRADYLKELYNDSKNIFTSEMLEDSWTLPTTYLTSNYIGEDQEPTYKLVKIGPEELKLLKAISKKSIATKFSVEFLLNDHQSIIDRLLQDPKFLSKTVSENALIISLGNQLREANTYEGYFTLLQNLQEQLNRVKKASVPQLAFIKSRMNAELKPYAVLSARQLLLGFNNTQLYKDYTECFIAADQSIEAHKICKTHYVELRDHLTTLLTDAGVPQIWETN